MLPTMEASRQTFLLLVVIIASSTVHSQTMQSTLFLGEDGTDFIPANPIELIAEYSDLPSFMSCYIQCNINPLCRTLVSDTTMVSVCRLYQGSIGTGTVITSSSSTSHVAGLLYDASLYVRYNQPCDPQVPPFDRYLVCINRSWHCPTATYWNGSMCLNQIYFLNSCSTDEACRQDVGLQCSSSCGKCLCNSTKIWNSTSCIKSAYPSSSLDPYLVALWPLDNDARDLTNQMHGTLIGSPSFVTGYVGQAIECSTSDYVQLSYIDFYRRSFTIELWLYRTNNSHDNTGLFGECRSTNLDLCLHLGINVDSLLHFGFWDDDSEGSTTIAEKQWHHVAFVYDYDLRQKMIYLNGIDEMMINRYPNTSDVYLGQSGKARIGNINPYWYDNSVYIDHVSVTHRAKTADEILNDATVLAYYSFDCGSTLDSGPNLQHGYAIGQTTVTGWVNEALLFASPMAYFQTPGFLAFGIVNQAFSISLWMKPLNLSGVVIHLSNQSTGDGWCMPLLGFNPSGNLVAHMSSTNTSGPVLELNVWTHVVQTFSVVNGLRLYTNGTMPSSSSVAALIAPYQPIYITVASQRSGGTSCVSGSIIPGPYTGVIDELRFFNREINATEISILSS